MSANFSNVGESFGLENQHGIAIAVESVLLFYGNLVGVHDQVVSSEGGRHHQQCGLVHVEVGHHAIGHTEIVWRKNELVGPTGGGLQFAQGRYR